MISRTNISVLLATALLGVLLWTVLGIVSEFGKIPAERPRAPEPEITAPDLDAINNRLELEVLLDKLTTEVDGRIENYNDWMAQRGFPEGYAFWNVSPPDTGDAYAARDNLSLVSMAGNGDIGAMYALADRRLKDDPLDALTWYDQAIAAGSLYAMLKTADLLETIADPQVQALFDSPAWARAFGTLEHDTITPVEKALAWSIAFVTIGGYSLVDARHGGRLERLAAQLDDDGRRRACETAETFVLDSAAAIRAGGGTVFSLDQPAIALTVPDPAAAIPCAVAVRPLINLENCKAHPVLAPSAESGSLWICPYSPT